MSGYRLAEGGRIDRSRPLTFRFEGRVLTGYAGDTLASALLANGIAVVGRSFKFHRARGLLAAGVEEPNALMQLGAGGRSTPNVRATEIELVEGLVVRPVNCWPSARFDLGAVANLFARFMPAGFYYKTFMWPGWPWFEPTIRKAAGMGRAAAREDPDRYAYRYVHCDLLVIGSGPSGLAAALAAVRRRARVILVEQDTELGGSLLWQAACIDGVQGMAWRDAVQEELRAADDALVLSRTTALGYFDHNSVSLVQRWADPGAGAETTRKLRQRLWTVRAKRVVLATGALERPLVFPGNDRPGVMLASAVHEYVARWAVMPGRAMAIFTNNDSAYATALAVLDHGGRVACLIDSRRAGPEDAARALRARGVDILDAAQVVATRGGHGLRGVEVRDAAGRSSWRPCDLLAMSGGWNPTVHLFSQSGGKLAWDDSIAAFRPDVSAQAEASVGAAAGHFDIATAMADGWLAGGGAEGGQPVVAAAAPAGAIEPLWRVEAKGKAFVDFQHDVGVADIVLARREAFVSVEHLKRYTTLGMAPDQGKTANVNALAIMAGLTGRSIAQTGTTRFRFPYTPVSLGALAGQARGALFRPVRRLPTHELQVRAGASFGEYGGWLRPARYPRPGESAFAAEQREALTVRMAVGLFESSPLGKLEVAGPDAGEFLDRVCANTMSTLPVGRARYGLMLNELGVVIDDGVSLRLAADRFLVGTTSSGAEHIAAWLEEWLQCEWRDLEVFVAPVSPAWAVLTLSGPKARAVLERAGTELALGAAGFPHMAFREGTVAGIPARIVRASFTGEVTFEINVPRDRAGELWELLLEVGEPCGLAPVGIDAWMLLRTEKGFLHVGADTDGGTSAADIGWGSVLKRPHDFIGRRSLTRPDNLRLDRLQFVGLEAVDAADPLVSGTHLRSPWMEQGSEGYVTSAGFSSVLGKWVGLGMIRRGRERLGEELVVVTGERIGKRVRVVKPGAYDPQGARLDG